MLAGQELDRTFKRVTVIHHNAPMRDYADHAHDAHEIIIPLFGAIAFQFADQSTAVVTPGQMMAIPQSCHHSARSPDQQGERIILLVKSAAFSLAEFALRPRLQLIVELAIAALQQDDESVAEQTAELMLAYLPQWLDRASAPVPATAHLLARAKDERLKKALALMEEHLLRDSSLGTLAKQAGMSERTLQRLCLAECGAKPLEIVTTFRMAKAVELLSAGQSVTATAYDVGYDSLSQFIARFRAVTGRIPSDFLP